MLLKQNEFHMISARAICLIEAKKRKGKKAKMRRGKMPLRKDDSKIRRGSGNSELCFVVKDI